MLPLPLEDEAVPVAGVKEGERKGGHVDVPQSGTDVVGRALVQDLRRSLDPRWAPFSALEPPGKDPVSLVEGGGVPGQ